MLQGRFCRSQIPHQSHTLKYTIFIRQSVPSKSLSNYFTKRAPKLLNLSKSLNCFKVNIWLSLVLGEVVWRGLRHRLRCCEQRVRELRRMRKWTRRPRPFSVGHQPTGHGDCNCHEGQQGRDDQSDDETDHRHADVLWWLDLWGWNKKLKFKSFERCKVIKE